MKIARISLGVLFAIGAMIGVARAGQQYPASDDGSSVGSVVIQCLDAQGKAIPATSSGQCLGSGGGGGGGAPFTPSDVFGQLTATASPSASTALPTNTGTVEFRNANSVDVSCTFSAGTATGAINDVILPANSVRDIGVSGYSNVSCINQTGSASNLILMAGGSGGVSGFGGGGSGGGGGGGAITAAPGSYAAGALVDGADTTEGAKGDAAYAGSGSASVIAILKGIYGVAGNAPTLGSATGGLSTNLQGALSTTVVAIDTNAGQLYNPVCYNPNSSVAFVQLFDLATGSVTLGTTAPKLSIPIPPGQTSGWSNSMVGTQFSTAISAAATTTYNGSTAPSSALVCNFLYK